MIKEIKSLATLQGVERVSVHFDVRGNVHVQVYPCSDRCFGLRDLKKSLAQALPGYDISYDLDMHVFDVYPV